MTFSKENIGAAPDDWSIPWWVKAILTFFTLSVGAVFVLSLLSTQDTLLSLPTQLIGNISLTLAAILILIITAFWAFPNRAFALSLYWLIRFLREPICILALLGMVYLLTVRVAAFSFRGGIPLLNLVLLFSMGLLVQPVGFDRFPLAWIERLVTFQKRLVNRINSMPTSVLSVAVSLWPILIVCAVIYVGLDSSLANYRPYSFWNDETGYWIWVRSFSHVGFNVGYNAPDELIAPAAFNRYGEGSPFYIYIYGTLGQLLGWSPHLPILINFAILAVAIFLFIHFTGLEPVQILLVGLITTVTWPILIYLPMTSHETLNQALGFVLAIVFFKLLTNREQLGWPARLFFVLLVFLAALIRLSWGLLLIPVIFYSLNGSVLRRLFLSVLLGSGLYLSVVVITSYLVPPTNNSILLNIKDSFVEGPRVFLNYVAWQFSRMFRFRQLNPNIAVMFQIVMIIGWNLIRLVRLIKSRLPAAAILQSRSVFDIYNMASLAAAGLLFYLQVGFYRTFAPAMLIVYLLQVIRKDYRLLATLLMINVLFFRSYMTFYAHIGDARIVKDDYTSEIPERAQLEAEIAQWIVFDHKTQNPWCNSLLIPQAYYDSRLIMVPPGIGISWIQEVDDLKTPLHSKYLLFDPETYEALADRLNIKPLASLTIGDLYLNLDSRCEFDQ